MAKPKQPTKKPPKKHLPAAKAQGNAGASPAPKPEKKKKASGGAATRALELAKQAEAEARKNQADGYATFQQALALAPDDETRAKVLLRWGGGKVEHDEVTPAVALCDLYELTKTGALTKRTLATALERVAHAWPLATSDRSREALANLLASRKLDRHAMRLDACQRWLALDNPPSMYTVFIVHSLIEEMLAAQKPKDGLDLYATWTPTFVHAHKERLIDDYTLRDSWYSSVARALSMAGLKKESRKVRKVYEAL